jgi:RNA polymerase sigma-70 factor (ECF subfamily)
MSAGASPEPARVAVAGDRPSPRLSGDPPSARELLELMREDSSRGAPLFYDRFQGEVNRLVWRLLGADPEHDDIVQQVFLIALRRVSQVREADRLSGWVRSIAVSTVYDEIRKRRVRRIFLRDAVPSEVHPSLVHDVEVRDFLLRAKRVMDMMPAGERMVFLLHVLEGKSLLEISELCGHSLATAKRRLGRANRRFEKLVTREPELGRMLSRAQLPEGDAESRSDSEGPS